MKQTLQRIVLGACMLAGSALGEPLNFNDQVAKFNKTKVRYHKFNDAVEMAIPHDLEIGVKEIDSDYAQKISSINIHIRKKDIPPQFIDAAYIANLTEEDIFNFLNFKKDNGSTKFTPASMIGAKLS